MDCDGSESSNIERFALICTGAHACMGLPQCCGHAHGHAACKCLLLPCINVCHMCGLYFMKMMQLLQRVHHDVTDDFSLSMSRTSSAAVSGSFLFFLHHRLHNDMCRWFLLLLCMHPCRMCCIACMSVCCDVEHGKLIPATTDADEIARVEEDEGAETRVPQRGVALRNRQTYTTVHQTCNNKWTRQVGTAARGVYRVSCAMSCVVHSHHPPRSHPPPNMSIQLLILFLLCPRITCQYLYTGEDDDEIDGSFQPTMRFGDGITQQHVPHGDVDGDRDG